MTPRWLSRLNLSREAERAIDQAVLDWRHEATTATTRSLVFAGHIRGATAVLRAAALSGVGEVGSYMTSPAALRFLATIALLAGLPWALHSNFGQFDLPNVRSLAWFQLSQTIGLSLPVSVFTAIAVGPRSAPSQVLSFFVTSGLVALLMMGVIRPILWQHYAEIGLMRQIPLQGSPLVIDVLALLLRLAAAILLADRVRTDPRRGRLVLGFATAILLLLGAEISWIVLSNPRPALETIQIIWSLSVITVSTVSLVVLSVFNEAIRLLLGPLPLPIVPLFLWYLLVRRHEKMRSGLISP